MGRAVTPRAAGKLQPGGLFFERKSVKVGGADGAEKKCGKGGTGSWHSSKRVACCRWVWNDCSF
jgi:hypothetical protein